MFIDASLLMASVQQALYDDDAPGAFDELQAAWPSLERSGLLRVPMYRFALFSRRAVAAFYYARREPGKARMLGALMRRDVRAFDRLRIGFAQGDRDSLLALHAMMEHRFEDAAAHGRAAVAASERSGLLPHAAAARCRLGELLGGDEGAALSAQGRAALRAIGVTDLEAGLRIG